MSRHDELVYLKQMLDFARKVRFFVAGKTRADFDADELLRLGLTHLIQIIGEAARQTSAAFREQYPTLPWKEIVGMRSKIVHDYLEINETLFGQHQPYRYRS